MAKVTKFQCDVCFKEATTNGEYPKRWEHWTLTHQNPPRDSAESESGNLFMPIMFGISSRPAGASLQLHLCDQCRLRAMAATDTTVEKTLNRVRQMMLRRSEKRPGERE